MNKWTHLALPLFFASAVANANFTVGCYDLSSSANWTSAARPLHEAAATSATECNAKLTKSLTGFGCSVKSVKCETLSETSPSTAVVLGTPNKEKNKLTVNIVRSTPDYYVVSGLYESFVTDKAPPVEIYINKKKTGSFVKKNETLEFTITPDDEALEIKEKGKAGESPFYINDESKLFVCPVETDCSQAMGGKCDE